MPLRVVCGSHVNNLNCKLDAGHSGSHDSKVGILWESAIRVPVKVEHYIVKGQSSGGVYLLTEYITSDGRKFFKKDYQISEYEL